MKKMICILCVAPFLVLLFSCGGETQSKIRTVGDCTQADVTYFEDFYSAMETAVKNRDAEKSFSFYSRKFMDRSATQLQQLKQNTETLYVNYKDLSFTHTDIVLNISGNEALSTDSFTYKAVPVDPSKFKVIDISGKERIYWVKEDGVWKIINWIND